MIGCAWPPRSGAGPVGREGIQRHASLMYVLDDWSEFVFRIKVVGTGVM